jgi:hypothetical protein
LLRRNESATDTSRASRMGVRQEVSYSLKILAIVLRSLFLIFLVAIIVRVSLPQSETIWTIYDEPADVARLLIGLLASVWIVYRIFRLPKGGGQGYRTWAYLGTILVPLAFLVLFAFW